MTPRLRVDNCYKVYSYTGVLLKTFDMKHTELYDVQWRNTVSEYFKTRRGVSPGRKIPDFTKKAEYKKFWRPMGFGGGIAASIINAEMDKNQARMVNKNENFGTKQGEQKTQLIIQYPEKGKKKYRKKKNDLY